MTWDTIGVKTDVKRELDRLKSDNQSWTHFMEELAETYKNRDSEDKL